MTGRFSRERVAGLSATILIHLAIVGLALFTWHAAPRRAPAATALKTFAIAALEPEVAPPKPLAPPPPTAPPAPRDPKPAVPEPVPAPTATEAAPVPLTPTIRKVDAPPPPRVTPVPIAPPPPLARVATDPAWEAAVRARIDRNKRYPRILGSRRPEGTVQVAFLMSREGSVLNASVSASSGNAQLDQAALDTVNRSSPLPVIPSNRPDPLRMVVPIEFQK